MDNLEDEGLEEGRENGVSDESSSSAKESRLLVGGREGVFLGLMMAEGFLEVVEVPLIGVMVDDLSSSPSSPSSARRRKLRDLLLLMVVRGGGGRRLERALESQANLANIRRVYKPVKKSVYRLLF